MALELTNSQYDRLMSKYQQFRFLAEKEAREHRILAYSKISELKDLDAAFLDATSRLKGKDLQDYIAEIADKRRAILTKHGYPADYLDIQYQCPDCNDTGFIDGARCHCFKKNVIQLIYGDKSWTSLFSRENFDTFDFSLYDKENQTAAHDAVNKSKLFVSSVINNKTPFDNLIISGSTGVGKTFLCNCIAKELIEAQRFVVYLSAPALFELFEKISFNQKRSADEYSSEIRDIHYGSIFDCDLLIIDDLGTEYVNSFTNSKLLDLINKRLTNGPTLISTNLGMEEIQTIYSERFLSRIVGNYKFIRLSGEDIRMKIRCNP